MFRVLLSQFGVRDDLLEGVADMDRLRMTSGAFEELAGKTGQTMGDR